MDTPWIPSLEYPTPLPRPLTLPIPPRVSDFITNEGCWNIELLSTYFCPRSVTVILSIPLPQVWVPDCFIWSQSRNGEYTAASGYRFARMSIPPPRSPTLGPYIHDSRLWTKVWSLSLQPKLRFFLRKLIHDILPASEALIHRRIEMDSFFALFVAFARRPFLTSCSLAQSHKPYPHPLGVIALPVMTNIR
ncbi:hypothetical protein LINGRAHAP2_LOCUS24300 [Linum grandiflorum]